MLKCSVNEDRTQYKSFFYLLFHQNFCRDLDNLNIYNRCIQSLNSLLKAFLTNKLGFLTFLINNVIYASSQICIYNQCDNILAILCQTFQCFQTGLTYDVYVDNFYINCGNCQSSSFVAIKNSSAVFDVL